MDELVKIGIRYKSFKIQRFAFEEVQDFKDAQDFQFQVSTGINVEVNRIIVAVSVEILRPEEKGVAASAMTHSIFNIRGLEETEGDIIDQIPEGLLVTAISLSISTTRGAILAKGAGSFLEHVMLPIANPKDFLPEKQELKKRED